MIKYQINISELNIRLLLLLKAFKTLLDYQNRALDYEIKAESNPSIAELMRQCIGGYSEVIC